MEIKRTIKFNIRPYGRDHYQIRSRTTFGGQRLDLRTGYQINDSRYWDEEDQTVSSTYAGSDGIDGITINNGLRNIREQMNTVFKFYEVNDVYPTIEQVRSKYLERINGKTVTKNPVKHNGHEEGTKKEKPKSQNFFKAFHLFMQECGAKNAWTEATFEKMNSLKRDLQDFKKDLKFSDLDESTLTRFVGYLRDTKKLRTPRRSIGDRKSYDKDDLIGLKNSTIGKKLGYFRWFMNWASAKGMNTNMSYKTFKPTLKQTLRRVIYLTKDELSTLLNMCFDEASAYLEPVRDVFLFCCFTGLRYSDACNLCRNDVKDDHIEVTTVKTEDSISIELNDISRKILGRYANIDFPKNKALPVLANQNFNRDLKKLCKLAGMTEKIRITTYNGNERIDEIKEKWELVGSHCGRRTFVVNALSLGIAPNVVMKWTGHSDYKSMKPYIDIVDSIKAAEMKKFNSIV